MLSSTFGIIAIAFWVLTTKMNYNALLHASLGNLGILYAKCETTWDFEIVLTIYQKYNKQI